MNSSPRLQWPPGPPRDPPVDAKASGLGGIRSTQTGATRGIPYWDFDAAEAAYVTKASGLRPDYHVLTVEEAGANLAQQIGKNRVSVMTPSGRISIDLAGKGHFVKTLGRDVPTPHVKFQQLNVAPNGRTSLSPGTTRPATMDDIRTARKIIERRND